MNISSFKTTTTVQEVKERYGKMVKRGYILDSHAQKIITEFEKEKAIVKEGQERIIVII